MPGFFKKKKPSKASVRKSVKQNAAAGLSKKDARRAAAAAKVMTKAEMGILKAGVGIGISKALHSDKAKQLLCGAVERFLQL